MCDHVLKRLSLYLLLFIFKGFTVITVDETVPFYHITFVRKIHLHEHTMCHIMVLCVSVMACVLLLYLPGKINHVSKKRKNKTKQKKTTGEK